MKVRLLTGLFLCVLYSSAFADLRDGLAVYYPFNGNANDESGHGLHGIVVDAELTQDEQNQDNSAYELDGVNDYIYFGPALSDMPEITIAAWLFVPTPLTGDSVILYDENLEIRIQSNTKVAIEARGTGGSLRRDVETGKQLTNRWIHLVWVMTESYSLIYIDGIECARVQEGGSNAGQHNLCIGTRHSRYYGPRDDYWKGKISSLRVYNRSLSSTEITGLYNFHESNDCIDNCPKNVTWDNYKKDLIAFYPFNGNAKDISGFDRHGSVVGAIPTQDQHGAENSAYELDGINDYIDFGPVLPDMTHMTISLWIYSPPPSTNRDMILSDDRNVLFWIEEPDRHIKIEAKKNGAPMSRALDTHTSIINRWVHFVWVLTPEHSSVYVDGVGSLRVYEWGSNVGNHDLFVGVKAGSFSGSYWKGKISSLRIYERALSSSEITGLHQLEASPDYREGDEFQKIDPDPADILYVDDDAVADPGPSDLTLSDPGENGTEEHPYDSIQEAIEVAENGLKIIVRGGTYYETIDFLGKRIHVTGYDPDVDIQRNQPCPVIDGNYQGTVVTFAGGEDSNTRLSGFTITRGLGRYAGGILSLGSHPTISNCLIVGNRAGSYFGGGAVYSSNSNASFEHCTISGNYGGQAGAGVYSEDSANIITNSILWDNLPAEIWYSTLGPAPIRPGLTYTALSTQEDGVGNLNADPKFLAPGYWTQSSNPDVPTDPADPQAIWIAGDYDLRHDSPCIDAGDPTWNPDANQLDLDGQFRVVNGRSDMGSDEYQVIEQNFMAISDNLTISLTQDSNAIDPERTYIGYTSFQLDVFFTTKLLAQALAVSDAGGTWSATLSPEIIGPALGVEVELTIRGIDVDISQLNALSGDIVLAEIELSGVFQL